MKKYRKILIISILLVTIIGFTVSESFAIKYPSKYKTKTYTNNYYSEDSDYSDGEYVWYPKTSSIYGFSNPFILETFKGNKTRLEFRIYNNNGNKYHHTDVKSSKMTIKYKIYADEKFSNTKTKTVTYTKIPKYGIYKSITLTSPRDTQVLISSIKWTQVHRKWY